MTNNLYDLDGNPVNLGRLACNPARPHRTKEEWLAYIQDSWATENQRGSIVGKFNALGIGRVERLDIISWLTGRDVSSSHDLRHGEAGKLIKQLEAVDTSDDLYDLLPGEYWQREADDERKHTWTGIAIMAAGILIALS